MTSDSLAVRLRPVQESDLEILERIDTEPATSEPFEWRGFSNPRVRRQQWEENGYLGPDYSLFAVAQRDSASQYQASQQGDRPQSFGRPCHAMGQPDCKRNQWAIGR